jgi:hypothetical protein
MCFIIYINYAPVKKHIGDKNHGGRAECIIPFKSFKREIN